MEKRVSLLRTFWSLFIFQLFVALPLFLMAGDRGETPPFAPKKPLASAAFAASATAHHVPQNPWDQEGFLWTHRDKNLFKPCFHIHEVPVLGQPQTWAQFIHHPLYARWKARAPHKPSKSIRLPYRNNENEYPWEIDPNFFNAKRFAQVQSFTCATTIHVLPPFSFADNLVHLDIRLPADGRDLCERISELTQLRSLTLETTLASSTGKLERYNRVLQPLSQLENLEHFSLDLSCFLFWEKEDNDGLLLDLGAIVQNNLNLKEFYAGETDHNDRTEPYLSGIETVLKDRAFEVLSLKGWEIKSLAWIKTEKLRNLGLYIAGTIEEGFNKTPLNLTRLHIDLTYFTFPFFETLPLEQITDVDLQAPCDLKVLERMPALRTFNIWGEDYSHQNGQASTCLQDLDCLHLENLKDASLYISDVDMPFVRRALEKKPAFANAITYVNLEANCYKTLADAMQAYDAGQVPMDVDED